MVESLAISPVICVDCELGMIETPIRNMGPDYKGFYNQTWYWVLYSWKTIVFSQGCTR